MPHAKKTEGLNEQCEAFDSTLRVVVFPTLKKPPRKQGLSRLSRVTRACDHIDLRQGTNIDTRSR
jgi:hypothetical protein